jgi:hypothetical protein
MLIDRNRHRLRSTKPRLRHDRLRRREDSVEEEQAA